VPIKLPAKQFDALLYFLQNPNRVIEKDELFAAIWPGRIVEESSLTQAIFQLRRVLQSDETDRYIVTAPGRGYRWVAEIGWQSAVARDVTSSDESPGQFAPTATSVGPAVAPAPKSKWFDGRYRYFAAIGAVTFLALVALSILVVRRQPAPPNQRAFNPPPHSVAVLAFTNMSGDPAQDYISDGLSEELIDSLSRVGTVQVAARTSAFSFKGGTATIDDIAHRLNVGAVVEGSVRRDGQRLRITVQLVNAVTGFQVWSRSYDRDITGLLALQSDIAGAIVDSLKVTLLAHTAGRLTAGGTNNPAAFEAYLRGARLMQTLTRASASAALAAFDEAIHFDPRYANAYAGRAEALLTLIAYWRDETDQDVIDTDAALAAADRAVALAPESPYAHTVRGRALLRKADFAQSLAELTIAHKLGPEDALATRGYAVIQCMLGHRAEAETASRHMIELDPLRPSLYHDRAEIQDNDRDYAGALETIRQELALSGDDVSIVRAFAAWVYLHQNKPQLAEQECKPGCAWPEYDNAIIAYKLGRAAEAQASLDKLHILHKRQNENPFPDDAAIYAQWGDTEKALSALEQEVREDPYDGRWIRVDPIFDPIRDTPEFRRIEANLHLPP
jgi:TolB-like protein/DNA-binding winged helix-turn-helix (wHTH) protein/tetratricopeptide (TPR) repeat protein